MGIKFVSRGNGSESTLASALNANFLSCLTLPNAVAIQGTENLVVRYYVYYYYLHICTNDGLYVSETRGNYIYCRSQQRTP